MSKDETVEREALERISPELIAQLNKLASYLTDQGEYEAVDLIDTVVARVSAMPGRELLRDALEALNAIRQVCGDDENEQHHWSAQDMVEALQNADQTARAAADKIRAALTEQA